jgi:hypothetical protein
MERLPGRQVRTRSLRRYLAGSACAAVFAALGGCGVSTPPSVGPITITNASGVQQTAITSLQHGTMIYMDVTVTHDVESLGADWTVTCGSSLPPASLPAGVVDTSCGTFVPNHTISGPIPSYPLPVGTVIVTQFTAPANIPVGATVTIVAHATSLPSSTSTLVLTIT